MSSGLAQTVCVFGDKYKFKSQVHVFNIFHTCFNLFLSLAGTAELGEGGGGQGGFSPQTQFLMAFLDHRVTKSCRVTRTATKIG